MGEAAAEITHWLPQPGPQTQLLVCPVREIFYGGARGGGKTIGLLGHWLDHAARHGRYARGIFFRRTYPELDEVQRAAREMYVPLGAVYREQAKTWTFPNQAELKLRYLDHDNDADNYQGHQYNWMAFDELTNWPSPAPIDRLRACLRDAHGVPCWLLGSGNPGGAGHQWVKARYIDAAAPNTPFQVDGEWRVFIPAKLSDNQILMHADPGYIKRIEQSGPAWLVQAWLKGDWSVVPGGFFEGAWRDETHVVRPFEIPADWTRWRALDWGFARPYSCGWYAMSPDGCIYRYRERYGDGGAPNVGSKETADMVAEAILKAEEEERARGIKFNNNPADTNIWNTQNIQAYANVSVLTVAEVFHGAGVQWVPATKGPSSREVSAQLLIRLLMQAQFKVFDCCLHWLRTVPVLVRDPDNPEDILDEQEDHAYDETRYSVVSRHRYLTPSKSKPKPKYGTFDWLIQQSEQRERSKYRLS